MTPVSLKITFFIGGRSVEISKNSVYRLLSWEGIDSSEYKLTVTENSQLDGAYLQSKRVPSRNINMSFEVSDCENTEQYRRTLISFFNPKNSGTLKVERGEAVRTVSFEILSVRFSQKTLFSPLEISVSLVCPQPYFTDPAETAMNLKYNIPLFTFPFNSVAGCGITSGLQKSSNCFEVINNGDVDIGVTVAISASGTVTNPYICCGGKTVRILDTMEAGEVYAVCTETGKKGIRKNGINIFNFDRTSVFFLLPVGTNTVTVSAESGSDNMNAEISCNMKYLGI